MAAKKAAKQLRENVWLGMLLFDYDWSENGLISAARQIQSEYWCLKYFSLFITICSYLLPDEWHDQASLCDLQCAARAIIGLTNPTPRPHPPPPRRRAS